ncbi:DUF2837 family protein [Pseudalkalibacillus caeni]|uniref:Lipid II flippase Amj n=1 Tax=Exobacillus caeni TaxID=2574798 RepID=A0A5R9F3T8_9BACL|nr:DUF2837 family protein [Pseudalkalibacillus caeni]
MIALFILLIHCIETLAYSTRISGARVGFIASALSLFNLMVIVSRMANMVQQPFTGSLLDVAPLDNRLDFVESQFRVIIGAASVGTILGILLLPTFVAVFSRAILHLRMEKGSVIGLFWKRLKLSYIRRMILLFRSVSPGDIRSIDFRDIPKSLFFTNMVVTAVYTIGVLSALYAALLAPDRASTAIMASGLVNGIATILLVLFVDPKISLTADEVGKTPGSYMRLRNMTAMMVLARFSGTLLAQILFIPGAYYVAWLTKYIFLF